jgi:hypothetical protein
MNYAIQGTAPQLKPGRGEPRKRSGGIPTRPEAGRPSIASIASRTRRHSLSIIRAALSHHRGRGGLPGLDSRESAGSGVSPIASGASRGVALFSSR